MTIRTILFELAYGVGIYLPCFSPLCKGQADEHRVYQAAQGRIEGLRNNIKFITNRTQSRLTC